MNIRKNRGISQAVVFTDTFNDEFFPLTENLPSVSTSRIF